MILLGDCRDSMAFCLGENEVQTVITSPPYFGLRDYGTAVWEGGDSDCAHSVGGQVQDNITTGVRPGADASRCRKCGAARVDAQIGLESTPDAYVAELVAVFREVRRVLRDDGTLWLNLGDSYCSTAPGTMGDKLNQRGILANVSDRRAEASQKMRFETPPGLKPKNLIGIPWRVAFALQADGWYLRQDIIWHKPNPMPESVRDRCTKAHEYLFLLTKSERYYWDYEAMQEPATGWNGSEFHTGKTAEHQLGRASKKPRKSGNLERKPASARGVPVDTGGNPSGAVAGSIPWEGFTRNKRSVWTIPTRPYKGAHFATFPPGLVEPCLLAGSRPGDTVLDPFMGSGTVGAVAKQHGRVFIGCELNPEYIELANARIGAVKA